MVLNFSGNSLNYLLPSDLTDKQRVLQYSNYEFSKASDSETIALAPYQAKVYELQ